MQSNNNKKNTLNILGARIFVGNDPLPILDKRLAWPEKYAGLSFPMHTIKLIKSKRKD